MKILISTLFLYPGRVGGAEYFLYNLLDGFIDLGVNAHITLLVNKEVLNFFPKRFLHSYNNVLINLKGLNRGIYEYFLDYFLDEILRKYDLIYFPNYITKINLSKNKVKTVTTIHDFQYLDYPEYFSFVKRLWLLTAHKHTLKNADKVIFISKFVYEKALKFFSVNNIKCSVIYNPISFKRFEVQSCSCGNFDKISGILNSKYFLTVAAQYPHKNLLTLIKAFKYFNKLVGNKYKLVLSGQFGENLVGNYKKYFLSLVKEIADDKFIRTTGYLCDFCLSELYKNCLCFAFPSIYEGFGMPPVEALGFGKPTIVSKVCSLPEVTKRKAIYVNNPMDPDEWVRVFTYCVNNISILNKHFSKLATEFRKVYAPSRIARDYWTVFEEVANV